jgi:hypothetical protein
MTPDERQQAYELRRRSRLLGLAIDQSIQGVKNIVVFTEPKLWDCADPGLMDHQKWIAIRDHATDILMALTELERKLASMADIYAQMVPNNQDATMVLNANSKSHDE